MTDRGTYIKYQDSQGGNAPLKVLVEGNNLLKIMAFAMKPTAGEVWFNGRQEVPLSSRVRSRVTLLTQKPYLLKRSVFDNIVYGLKIRKDRENIEGRIKETLKSVGLSYGGFAHRQ